MTIRSTFRLLSRGLGTLGCVLAGFGAAAAQNVTSPLVPAGRLRLEAMPTVRSWDTRFGLRSEGGSTVEEVESVGFDLTDVEGLRAFPGVVDLQASLRELLDDPALTLRLGSSVAEVTQDRIRVPLRAELGVYEWLTVGVNVPLVKVRTEASHLLSADSSELGISPSILSGPEVALFIADAERARAELNASAASADLKTEFSALVAGLETAYRTASLFPIAGSPSALALEARLAELNGQLEMSGVAPVGPSLPFAGQALTGPQDVGALLSGPQFAYLAPVQTIPGVWALGDVEIYALARLLYGERRDSAEAPPTWRWEVGAGGLLRLGTGAVDDFDLIYHLGSGDGQTDLEARVYGLLSHRHFGLWADFRYGVQQSTSLVRRVAPPDEVFASAWTRSLVDWTPGNYKRFDLSPHLRLTGELTFVGSYRYFGKAEDEYASTEPPEAMPGVFPGFRGPSHGVEVLGRETEQTYHEVGGGMIYSTMDAWREGDTTTPFEARFLLHTTKSGSGGLTPQALRATFGVRLYRRLWGS